MKLDIINAVCTILIGNRCGPIVCNGAAGAFLCENLKQERFDGVLIRIFIRLRTLFKYNTCRGQLEHTHTKQLY